MGNKAHWERIYETKAPNTVSWYQAHATKSLQLIDSTGLEKSARIIDIGAGVSTFVDDLLDTGYESVTLLDISAVALQNTRKRLGALEGKVSWIEGDVTNTKLPSKAYDLWHDRAVFHFLTAPSDRHSYVEQLKRTVREGGFAIIATFGPHGPLKCSELDIIRYSPTELEEVLGHGFELVVSEFDEHLTPKGTIQEFTYCLFKVNGRSS